MYSGMTTETATAVAAQLQRQSDVFTSWTFEYPGYIAIVTDGGQLWTVGTANGTWGADLYLNQQSFIDGHSPDCSVTTDVSADATNVDLIVARLYTAMSSL
jgi:hypothetical protein